MKVLPATLLVLLLLPAAVFVRGEVQLSYFRVEKENTSMVLDWEAETEVSVRAYEVLRRTPYTDGAFARAKVLDAHGAGRPYRFVDDQVYKSGGEEQIDYQLVMVGMDGTRTELGTRSVNYTSTAVRRTWGSIKAMFQ